jgi:hypothetical protein
LGEIVIGVHANDDSEPRHFAFDAPQDLQADARTIGERPAVFVGAPVFLWAEELGEQIAMGNVQFNAIEICLLRPTRSSNECLHGQRDSFPRHFQRRDRGSGHFEHVVGYRGGRDRGFTANVLARVPAGMAELN